MAAAATIERACAAPGCGRPAASGRPHGRYCGPRCRNAANRARRRAAMAAGNESPQLTLAQNPAVEKRLTPRELAVLRALRAGGRRGCSHLELVHVGGTRFGARLRDLRQRGYVWESKCVGLNQWRYVLISEPGVLPSAASALSSQAA